MAASLRPTSVELELRRSVLLSGVSRPAVRAIAAAATVERFKRGDVLWRPGDAGERFLIVLEGGVKLSRWAPDGVELVVWVFGPGESVADAVAVSGGPEPACAIALRRGTRVAWVPRGSVLGLAARDETVASAIRCALIAHVGWLHQKIAVVSAGGVAQRLATVLLHLGDRLGEELADGSVALSLVLTRQELAGIVGARVETVIREVRAMDKAGLVQMTPDGIVLSSPNGLRALLDGEHALG